MIVDRLLWQWIAWMAFALLEATFVIVAVMITAVIGSMDRVACIIVCAVAVIIVTFGVHLLVTFRSLNMVAYLNSDNQSKVKMRGSS